MGLSLRRKRNAVYLLLIVMAIVSLVVIGCDSLRSGQDGTEAATEQDKLKTRESTEPSAEDTARIRDIEPTKDTADFYKAVKGANKVVIIAGDMGDPLEDREQVPLNAFNSHEIEFWHILGAITSAVAGSESPEQESDYVVRWYDKYKKLGEAKINKESGLTELRYIVSAGGKLAPEGNTISGHIFIPKKKLTIIKDTAAALLNQREKELEKAKNGHSRGVEI